MTAAAQVRDAMQFINEQDTATLERFIRRLEYRGTDPTFTAYRDAYLKLLDLPPAAAVLDLGCGTGVVTRAIAARDGFTGTVTGIDQSLDFIAAAQRPAADEGVADRVEFLLGDAHALDLPAASFDAVVAHTLVSHVRDPLAVLAQAGRALRPGGSAAIFDGDYASLTFGCSDPRLGERMEAALQAMIMSAPRVMRELPRLLPQAGLRLIATQAHVLAEAGASRFLLNLAETYAPLAASSGLLPTADVWDRVADAEERAGMDRIDLTRRAAEAAQLGSDRERAIALARDAAARIDARRDPVRAGLINERLGRYLWVLGRGDEAAAAYRDAVATMPADPPSAERARVVAAEGQLLMLRGLARDAIARCEEALAVARAVGARAEAGHALNTLGAVRSGLGEHEAGEAHLREALAIALDLQLPDDVGRAYINLSDCVDQSGRIDEAAQLALEGLETGRPLGLGTGYRAMLLTEAAQRRFRGGRWDDAERLAGRALALRAGGLVDGIAHATVGHVAVARGDLAAAQDGFARAREIFRADSSAMWHAPVGAGAASSSWRPDVPRRAERRHAGTRAHRGTGVPLLRRTSALGRPAGGGRACRGGPRALRPGW